MKSFEQIKINMVETPNSELAIVIPAYKQLYLRETLTSIANQTNQHFTVYIGDDASPYDLNIIAKDFSQKFKLVYKRFDENLGSRDLVAHWNRCIEMCDGEEWIWLFSDDDLMQPRCVELFYENLLSHQNEDLFHFEVEVIDQNSEKISSNKNSYIPFPEKLSSESFFDRRIRFEIQSFVVEYIVRSKTFHRLGKFDYFDLAWGADDVAWIKFSQFKGIRTITGAKVEWRLSNSNISSFEGDEHILLRKLHANISYLNWVRAFFKTQDLKDATTEADKFRFAFAGIQRTSVFGLSSKCKIAANALDDLKYKTKLKIILSVAIKELKRKLAIMLSMPL